MINNFLDKLVRPEVRLFHKSWSAFQVCGYIGALAVPLAMILVTHLGLSPWIMAGLLLAATLTFFGLAMATKIITGKEQLICYRHKIAVMIVLAFVLWLLRQPILPYLDVTILSVGTFLACGRVGCLMVGCCHGRPHRWGVCYREGHVAAGFTPCLVGVRLFPIQVVESLWCLSIVLVGSAFVISGTSPGEALAWYVITYSGGRFFFEFMRGDHDHSYLLGFSRPQWTSLVFMLALGATELSGMLAFHLWHMGAIALILLTTIVVILKRRFQRTAIHQLLHPRHIKEVAQAISLIQNPVVEWAAISRQNPLLENILLGRTSLGIQISANQIRDGASCIYHYAISHQNGIMTEETARTLAGLILRLKHPSGSSDVIKGNQDVFHLLIHPASDSSANWTSTGELLDL